MAERSVLLGRPLFGRAASQITASKESFCTAEGGSVSANGTQSPLVNSSCYSMVLRSKTQFLFSYKTRKEKSEERRVGARPPARRTRAGRR
jgi:hypothetical protein